MKSLNWLVLSILLLMMGSNISNAQTPQARQFLNEVSKRYDSFTTMAASFTLTISNEDAGLQENKKGEVKISGEKYVVEMDDLMRVCDGASIWTFFKEDDEVQINEFDPEEQELSPAELFTIYEKDYDAKIIDEQELNGSSYYIIDLHPLEPEEHPYHSVRVTINKDSQLIQEARIKAKNGTDFIYSISEFHYNQIMDGATFSFDPDDHGDIDIIDLR